MNSSIYFHIPYCKQACTYCDFHFSTNLNTKELVLKSMFDELEQQSKKAPWKNTQISSIYFGGGTPSLLGPEQIQRFIQEVKKHFKWYKNNIEITLEANPDDITPMNLSHWFSAGINRLSVGIQSFHHDELQISNRAHNAKESKRALEFICNSAFENYSIDLIYGMPGSTLKSWQENLENILQFNPPHMSCYSLTVEHGTVLKHQVESGKIILPSDDGILSQYTYLIEWARKNKYDHYELSSFSKMEFQSIHNQHYWSYQPYLGIGPGAHSFDGKRRFWNISNNNLYLKGSTITEERLSIAEQINERLIVRLRTAEGFRFNFDLPQMDVNNPALKQLKNNVEGGFNRGIIHPMPNGFRILPEKWMTSDSIIASLMIDHDEDYS
jgi:oxygen-independent coproporphyrinogen-3 oxidase